MPRAFRLHCRELLGAELAAFEICAKARRTACQMLRVETHRSHSVRSRPDLFDGQRRDGALDVFADVFTRAEQMPDDGINPGHDPPHPWLGEWFTAFGFRQAPSYAARALMRPVVGFSGC